MSQRHTNVGGEGVTWSPPAPADPVECGLREHRMESAGKRVFLPLPLPPVLVGEMLRQLSEEWFSTRGS